MHVIMRTDKPIDRRCADRLQEHIIRENKEWMTTATREEDGSERDKQKEKIKYLLQV